MTEENTTPLYMLYTSRQEFEADLDAARKNALFDHQRAQIMEIELRYESQRANAELRADEHELIVSLACERQAIGPTDI